MAFIETEKEQEQEQEQLGGGMRDVIPQCAAQLQQPLRLLMVTLKFVEPTSITCTQGQETKVPQIIHRQSVKFFIVTQLEGNK